MQRTQENGGSEQKGTSSWREPVCWHKEEGRSKRSRWLCKSRKATHPGAPTRLHFLSAYEMGLSAETKMTRTLVGGPSGKRRFGDFPGDSERDWWGRLKSLAEIRAPTTEDAQRGPVTCPPSLSWWIARLMFCLLGFFFSLHRIICRILIPQPGMEPRSQQWKRWVLTTGLPGDSQGWCLNPGSADSLSIFLLLDPGSLDPWAHLLEFSQPLVNSFLGSCDKHYSLGRVDSRTEELDFMDIHPTEPIPQECI